MLRLKTHIRKSKYYLHTNLAAYFSFLLIIPKRLLTEDNITDNAAKEANDAASEAEVIAGKGFDKTDSDWGNKSHASD